jgi:hypothetical protein
LGRRFIKREGQFDVWRCGAGRLRAEGVRLVTTARGIHRVERALRGDLPVVLLIPLDE